MYPPIHPDRLMQYGNEIRFQIGILAWVDIDELSGAYLCRACEPIRWDGKRASVRTFTEYVVTWGIPTVSSYWITETTPLPEGKVWLWNGFQFVLTEIITLPIHDGSLFVIECSKVEPESEPGHWEYDYTWDGDTISYWVSEK